MTSTFPDQHSDTRIFVLSALGSLLLHGLLMAGLAYVPKSQLIDKQEIPTVQVTLLPTSQTSQVPPNLTYSLQPHVVMPHTTLLPLPPRRPNQAQPPPLLQASLMPPEIKPSPLTPASPAKSILQDTRASQAMKARSMMKMRVSAPTQQTTSSLLTLNTRTHAISRVIPPITTVRKERSADQALPVPPRLAKAQTLTATPPAHTGSTITHPTIISSSRPIYPRVARESGWKGTVIVRTLIDTNGVPKQVKIRKSCGHPTLDQAAQDAVKIWIFQPAQDGNIPITKWVDIPIKFNLTS